MAQTLTKIVYLFLFLLILGSDQTLAQSICSSLFQTQSNPTLQTLLNSSFMQRAAKNNLSQIIYQKMKLSMDEAISNQNLEGGLSLFQPTDPIEMWGQFEEVDHRILRINIVQLYLTSEGRNLNIGEHPTGLNLQFVSFIQATLNAALYWTQSHPEVQQIKFIANEISNPSLPQLIQRLGFKSTTDNQSTMSFEVTVY